MTPAERSLGMGDQVNLPSNRPQRVQGERAAAGAKSQNRRIGDASVVMNSR